jgi:hypothetical protein
MVFAFGAMINRMSAAGGSGLLLRLRCGDGPVAGLDLLGLHRRLDRFRPSLSPASPLPGLSLYGYVTKRDLGPMGAFLMMGLIGLIVASIVNIFIGSQGLAFAISVIGVLIFAGLTAYDTQRIKNDYIQHAQAMDSEWLGKSAIMGALNLYLDFINLFMFLLQFMGNRE